MSGTTLHTWYTPHTHPSKISLYSRYYGELFAYHLEALIHTGVHQPMKLSPYYQCTKALNDSATKTIDAREVDQHPTKHNACSRMSNPGWHQNVVLCSTMLVPWYHWSGISIKCAWFRYPLLIEDVGTWEPLDSIFYKFVYELGQLDHWHQMENISLCHHQTW